HQAHLRRLAALKAAKAKRLKKAALTKKRPALKPAGPRPAPRPRKASSKGKTPTMAFTQ
ncbi:MAG: hypothetical protein JWN52_8194, partial [Actinomycetia bacterium]|nr:hypothetical protein [Actinomycetes bacterium]